MKIFYNAMVYENGKDSISSVFVGNGLILHIENIKGQPSPNDIESICKKHSISPCNIDLIDCENKHLLPSCIDINIFPKDKNLNAKNIKNLAKKALLGGVSSIFLNPYTTPSIDNEAMNALICSMDLESEVNIFQLIATLIEDSKKLNNIDTMRSLNSNAKAIFSNSCISSNLLYQSMQYAKMLNMPLCVFPFDFNMEEGIAYESTFSRDLGLPMMTPLGQLKEVAKIKEMANFLEIEVLFTSINIPAAIDMVEKDSNLYVQVGLPHLVFSEQDISDYDTRYKIMPPLLTRSKKTKLIERLKEGKISMLASMQSEISPHCKQLLFESADFGLDGIAHFFSLAYTHLVRSGLISLDYLIELLSSNAARLLGLNKGAIKEGFDADFMIVDLDSKYYIDNPLSPYHNNEVYGKISKMVINGRIYGI